MKQRRIDWIGPVAALGLALWVPLFLGALGANPARFEELAVGGGTADTVDGGVDLEKDGDIATTGQVAVGASTTARASLNVPHGTAPSSPVNGDMWSTTAGFYARVNGSTVGPWGVATAGDVTAAASLTDNYLVRGDGGSKGVQTSNVQLTDDDALVTVASDAAAAGLRVPHGTAPSSPVNGDVWTTTAGLYVRVNGATLGPYTHGPASVTDNTIPRFDGTTGKLQTGTLQQTDDDTLVTVASDTTAAGLRLPHGAAPSAPTNGDIWTTTSGLYFQINGGTIGPIATGTGDVTAAANLTDNKVMRGDGGSKGAQTSLVGIDDSGNITTPGTLAVDGATATFGDGAGDQTFYVDGGAAQYRRQIFRTGGANRWALGANQDSESGSDAGSNFVITNYDDDGLPLDDVFEIARATGDVTIPYLLKLGSGPVTINNSAGKVLHAALEQNSAADGDVLSWNGSAWAPRASSQPVLLTAGGALFPGTNPAVGKDYDANYNMCVEFAASDTAFWQFVVPEDYDGSVESIKVYWYKADTNAVTWSLARTILSEGDPMTESTEAQGSNSETPTADDQIITTITDADLLGLESNAGDAIKIFVSTNAFSGTSAFLLSVKIEY